MEGNAKLGINSEMKAKFAHLQCTRCDYR
ncbi:hypothetical protein A2U01_0029946, partial [Trifolium medium]|nr:hypothetical protein [Trifolium medium]